MTLCITNNELLYENKVTTLKLVIKKDEIKCFNKTNYYSLINCPQCKLLFKNVNFFIKIDIKRFKILPQKGYLRLRN